MSVSIKLFAFLLAIVFVSGSFAGCGLLFVADETVDTVQADSEPISLDIDTSVPRDGRLSVSFVPSDSLNPFTGTSRDNLAIGGLLYEGLFALGENFAATPVLANNMTTLDGRRYTLEIQSGVTFHNGASLTVEDVIYSLGRARASALFGGRLGIVTGYDRRYDAQGEPLEFEMDITLDRVHGNLPVLLTFPIIQRGTFGWNTPPGTGPYRRMEDASNRLERFAGHRFSRELPSQDIYLIEIATQEQLTAYFNSGLLDVAMVDPTMFGEYRLAATRELRHFEASLMDYIGFNLNRPETGRREVRLAISRIVDRSYITENIMRGGAVASPLPLHPSLAYFDNQLAAEFGVDPALAHQILADVPQVDDVLEAYDALLEGALESASPADEMPEDADDEAEEVQEEAQSLPTLTLLMAGGDPLRMEIAVYIADSISQLGYQVIIDERPHAEFLQALRAGDFDLFYGQVRLQPDFDLSEILFGNLAFGGVERAVERRVVDDFLAAGQSGRAQQATVMSEAILREAPLMVVGFRHMAVATQRGVVSGLDPTQENIFNNIWDWLADV